MKNDCVGIGKHRKKFRSALKYFGKKEGAGGARAWLLDNAWLVEKAALASEAELKGRGCGLENAYALAQKLACRHGEGLDAEKLRTFLKEEGRGRGFTEKELILFPTLLKAAFIEKAARLAKKLAAEPDAVEEAKNEKEAGRIIKSIRFLSEEDLSGVTEACSAVHALFSEFDPSGYGKTDKKGRSELRYALSLAAEKNGLGEAGAAKCVINLCEKHSESLWYYVFDKPLGKEENGALRQLFALPPLFAALVAAALVWVYGGALPAVLSLLPAAELSAAVCAFFILRTRRGRYMPRLIMDGGIPDEAKSICALVVLLRSEHGAREYAAALESIMLTNRDCGKNMAYVLLADLPEAENAELPGDEAVISYCRAAIDALNARYGGQFCLALRKRKYNSADGAWRGEERKRGAVEALAAMARGEKTELKILAGDEKKVSGAKYIVTLDADTRPEPGALLRLVETIAHPASRPETDRENRRIIRGCGLIQPALCCDSESAAQSAFSAVYSGGAGFGFYNESSSELYETLFHRGSYTGKGIISVEAMKVCLSGRIAPNTLLSHDLIEGEYLNSARSSEIEFSESFPAESAGYFSRLERWTRGDWQTFPWLFGSVRNGAGEECRNPIGIIGKIKIADNLRRSLTAPAIMLCFALSAAFGGAWNIAAAIGAAALCVELIISFFGAAFSPATIFRAKYRRKRMTAERAAIPRALLRFAVLPHEAATLFSAAVKGVYRLRVSHKRLLEWTTAEESAERGKTGLVSYYVKMLACPIFALAALLSPAAVWRAAGALWLAAPALCYILDRPRGKKAIFSEKEAEEIKAASGEAWKYFSENLTAERNFLPPDNIRTEPELTVAERTSPTNIGLAMLSCVAACELGLCGRSEAITTIRSLISTIEKMPKWRGLLYNWYDIKTLLPLSPMYVSSVDCANYAACLTAVKGFLTHCGEEETEERATALLDECRLDLLFDEKKKLFYIGLNTEQSEFSPSHYDLYASEALLLSYYASAKGYAGAEHWRSLARTVVSAGEECGLASWSGTMFEYFMPFIFLPATRGSLYDEALTFCLDQQIKDGRLSGVWGKSESAYRAFDRAGDYRYKANGVSALALRRSAGDENVVSPYSSFLALEYAGKRAVKNLRRLAKRSMKGRYGYYEALDLTRGRDETGRGKSVKCFMAHHIGMSLSAAANALCGGVIREYFLADSELRAFLPLMKERAPVGRLAARKNETFYGESRKTQEIGSRELAGEEVFAGKCGIYGNGVYTVLVSSLGSSRSSCMGRSLAPFGSAEGAGCGGISLYAYDGETLHSLQPAPEYRRDKRYGVLFSLDSCVISSRMGELELEYEISVSASESGEMRRVRVKNHSQESKTLELVLFVEPSLCPDREFEAHPAFNELCMETDYRAGAVTVTRRADGFTAAFACSEKFSFDTFEERCLGRGEIKNLPEALKREAAFSAGAAIKPCVLMRAKLRVPAGKSGQLCYSAAMAGSRETAIRSAREIAAGAYSKAAIAELAAQRLSMSGAELAAAFDAVSAAINFTKTESEEFVSRYSEGRRALWRFGISGDIPVFCAHINEGDRKKTLSLVRLQRFLTFCGFACDLALVIDDKGDYFAPARTMICLAELELACSDGVCAEGGVYICEGAERDINALRAACDAILDGGSENSFRAEETRYFSKPNPRAGEISSGSFTEDGGFSFVAPGALGGAVWSNILTNGRLGYIAMDCGCGEMWLGNARERRITPWTNDYLACEGGETLEIDYKGEKISLFAANDSLPCRVSFGFGCAEYAKLLPDGETVTTQIFIHPELDARIMIVNAPSEKLIHRFRLLLGENEQDSRFVSAGSKDGVFFAESAAGKLRERFCEASNASVHAEHDERGLCCIEYASAAPSVIVSGTETGDTLLSLASPENAEAALAETKELWQEICRSVRIFTPCRELDDYVNGWAMYQTLACRIMGRCSVYQSGGAYGFRDQLQDASSICLLMPEITRAQIILAARHQYIEGDVQHWWHPGAGERDKGVRTRCSDDLLWLPYALCRYLDLTGDESILQEKAGYLKSPPLAPHEKDRYEQPEAADADGTILEHALKAAETALSRGRGAHGLLLFGSGDWNDGFDKLDGESVWLSWFAAMTLRELSKIAGEAKGAKLLSAARDIAQAADNAWDGEWYYRGTWADGAILGSKKSRFCQIDSIAQSFSVLSGFGSPERAREAVLRAYDMLYDAKNKTVSLFSPPFSGAWRETGYIENYLPGVRENGGQYTHAAIWLAMALFRLGEADKAMDILLAALPTLHPQKRYMAEPYVLAADIYTNPQHAGRGGWSWYTGSSGWFLRAVLEELFGVKRVGGVLTAQPRFPKSWGGSSVLLSILGEEILSEKIEYAKR